MIHRVFILSNFGSGCSLHVGASHTLAESLKLEVNAAERKAA
jgi:hypothetical protein